MKNIILLTIFCLVLTSSVRLRRASFDPLPKLQELKDQSDFAKTLIANLEMHLQSGGKVEDVIKYVREALATTQNDLTELKTEYASEMERYEVEISGLESDISSMEQDLVQAINEISDLGKQIQQLEVQEQNIQGELDQLQERENNIRQARDNDADAFIKRSKRDQNAVQALNEIIPQLQDLLLGGQSLVQKTQEEISQYLRDKDISDSVRSLVQTSMKFNKAKLTTVIEKLQDILEAVEAGQKMDKDNEAQSILRFKALVQEIETLRAEISKSLKLVRSKINIAKGALQAAKANKGRLEISITSTTTLKNKVVQTKENAASNFQKRIGEGKAAVQALQDALAILEENQQSLSRAEQRSNALAGL